MGNTTCHKYLDEIYEAREKMRGVIALLDSLSISEGDGPHRFNTHGMELIASIGREVLEVLDTLEKEAHRKESSGVTDAQ